MFKRKKRSLSAPARIVSADGNKVVVEVEIDKAEAKKHDTKVNVRVVQ